MRGVVSGTAEFLYLRSFLGFRGRSLRIDHIICDGKLLEAAGDLGANGWQRFRGIERPLPMPRIVLAGSFQ
jgi:ABC-type spermidine/putrescine transport system permease subunit II